MKWISILYFFGWLVFGLLFLVFLFLFLPIDVDINNREGEFKLKIKLWFLDFDHLKNLFSKRVKKKEKTSGKNEKRGRYKETIKYVKLLLVNARKILRLAIKNITFKKLKLKIFVGSGEASKTALEYGGICSVFYPAAAALLEINEPKNYDLSVAPDFSAENMRFDVDIGLKTRLFSLLIILINMLKIIRSN